MKSQNSITIPFTKIGYEKVLAELVALEEERKEVLVRLQTAREMGDLSENGAYKAARWELGGIDRRLRELNRLKLMGRVTEAKDGTVISFGSRVRVKNEAGQDFTYELVNEYESDPSKNKLSVHSPLGRQLEGKRVGDAIEVEAPAGTQKYLVLEVGPLTDD